MRIGIQKAGTIEEEESGRNTQGQKNQGKKKLILVKSSVLITFTVIYSNKPSKYRQSPVVLVLV